MKTIRTQENSFESFVNKQTEEIVQFAKIDLAKKGIICNPDVMDAFRSAISVSLRSALSGVVRKDMLISNALSGTIALLSELNLYNLRGEAEEESYLGDILERARKTAESDDGRGLPDREEQKPEA